MPTTSFQQLLLIELDTAWLPLQRAVSSAADFDLFLEALGWQNVPTSPLPRTLLLTSMSTIAALIEVIRDLIENPPESLGDVIHLLENAQGLGEGIVRLCKIGQEVDPSGLAPELASLGQEMLGYLVTHYVVGKHPIIHWSLVLLGLIEEPIDTLLPLLDAEEGLVKYQYTRPRPRFDRLGQLFTDPVGLWKGIYLPPGGAWPTTDAEAIEVGQRLFPTVRNLLRSVGLFAAHGHPAHVLRADPAIPADSADNKLVFSYENGGGLVGAELTIEPSSGIVVTPFGGFDFTEQFKTWQLVLSALGTIGGFTIRSTGVTYVADPSLHLTASLTKLAGPDGHEAFLIGSTTGTRLEIGKFELDGLAHLQDQDTDFGLHARASQSALVIAGGDGDGFLSKILPPEGVRIGFELGIGWSKRRGFYFEGGVNEGLALVVKIPVHQTLFGVITAEDVRLAIRPQGTPVGVKLELGGTIITKLGPLTATVENMGLALSIEADPEGNFGPVAVRLKFKPPSGIALVVQSDAVTGGGYLSFGDHRYTGILQLKILKKIGVTAIAIVTTELPGGAPGFSLFILIAVEFNPGIQLGMGFALTGVGGLLGLNRGMDPEALRQGVRSGSLGDILFPQDALASASQIIAQIEGFFPIQKDRFVFGPMFRIAWGTPAIVTLELGLVIEVPNPLRIALPGVLRMALPKPDAPVLELNVSFLGLVDFGKKFVSIDASLFDSKLLTFTLEGDIALRLNWGKSPLFIYSMGGFHPSFPLPGGLGLEGMKRLTLSMINRPKLRLTFDTYLAVTSNTVQFGSRAQLYVGFGIGSIEGLGGFDAIFYFNPFRMDVAAYFAAALRIANTDVLAIAVNAQLTGPTPWHIHGLASFTFLGTEYAVAVDHTWGEQVETLIPTIDVKPLLVEALDEIGNWSASFDESREGQVTLRSITEIPAQERLVLHPHGELQIDQRVVPLDTTLDLFSNQPIEGAHSFSIDAVEVLAPDGTTWQSLGALEPLETGFARAQYQDLTPIEKLTSPSFTDLPSGVRVRSAASAVTVGGARVRAVVHETFLIDAPGGPSIAVNPVMPSPRYSTPVAPRFATSGGDR
jgi:hypothetical protein